METLLIQSENEVLFSLHTSKEGAVQLTITRSLVSEVATVGLTIKLTQRQARLLKAYILNCV